MNNKITYFENLGPPDLEISSSEGSLDFYESLRLFRRCLRQSVESGTDVVVRIRFRGSA